MSESIQLSGKDNVLKLYDGDGRVISEFHPDFKERLREFGVGGYNPDPRRRGSARPISQSGSETWQRGRDRWKAMADARDAALYDWIGGVLARIVLYVAGKIHCRGTIGDPAFDEAYDNYFFGWCGDQPAEDETTRCDITGRHRLSKMMQMALLAYFVDGDYGFVEVDPQFSPTGEFCLQGIEADRIGNPRKPSRPRKTTSPG
jgi:hypothetical protein